jgi:NADH-quinone oxidoreductase subunit C
MTAPADLIAALQGKFPSVTLRPSADHPAVTVSAADVVAALAFLRDDQGYEYLADLTAIDWSAEKTPRFTVVWHLYSLSKHSYLRVAADCTNDANPEMPTTVPLWPGANWHEREAFDMFGIQFAGHPDLRRILMWEGYPYFPLRKEFPLAGLPTDLPDPEVAAETGTRLISAPMAGGPFVAPGSGPMSAAEPRAKDEAWSEQTEKPDAS